MMRRAVIFASILLVTYAEEICYDEIGCFSKEYPFKDLLRPISFLPQSPEVVGTTFFLNTRNNSDPSAYDSLTNRNLSSISSSFLNPLLPTKVIVHGFTQDGHVEWMRDMMAALLQQGNYNVIRVSWSRGAFTIYGRATANTRIVGAEISLLMDKIREVYPNTTVADPSSWHIIGHSLGAHVAGYAGERRYGRIGRITGLDPAGPYFKGTDIIVRLDPTDAIFVDVIHTDTTACGIHQAVGDMDFYVNGGRYQPGCPQPSFDVPKLIVLAMKDVSRLVACNHLRSYKYFTESILSSCPFMARRADSNHYGDYYQLSRYFDNAQGAKMGFYADQYRPSNEYENHIYMSSTLSEAPYCAYQYRVTIFFDNPNSRANDSASDITLHLTVTGTEGRSQPTQLGPMTYRPGVVADFRLNLGVDVGNLVGLEFYWDFDPDSRLESDDHGIYINKIEVQSMEWHADYLFCGPKDKINSQSIHELFPAVVCSQSTKY